MAVITDDEERSLLGHILEAHRPELEYPDIDRLKPSQEKAVEVQLSTLILIFLPFRHKL
ncbi:hypothetical protein ES703_73153 [subsurface metagenome]